MEDLYQHDSDGNGNLVARPIETPYTTKRLVEYPSIGDQLDMLWHAMDQGSLTQVEPFYTTIKEIKDKYPKS